MVDMGVEPIAPRTGGDRDGEAPRGAWIRAISATGPDRVLLPTITPARGTTAAKRLRSTGASAGFADVSWPRRAPRAASIGDRVAVVGSRAIRARLTVSPPGPTIAPVTSGIEIGTVLRGKYRVERVLGTGGMGRVVAARQLQLDRQVAIKVLLPELLEHAEMIERFLREARSASKLESPHVARVIDVDTLDDGAPYMVMEYLEGVDLSSVRKSGRPLAIATAVDYVLQAAAGLGEAHSLGIVHRDVKPANLFLAKQRDGGVRVKVLDFGISKVSDPTGTEPSVTKTLSVMGSAQYMSPEQMRSARDVDARTDIWSLGVVLYELCTARVPYPGKTITEVCARVFTEAPPPPRSFRPDMPPALEAAILRCLARDREQRFASAAELSAAIAPFARDDVPASVPTVAGPYFAGSADRAPLAPAAADVADPQGDSNRTLPFHPRLAGLAAASGATTAVVSTDAVARPARSHVPLGLGLVALAAVGLAASAYVLHRGATAPPPAAASSAAPAPVATEAASTAAPVPAPSAEPAPTAAPPPASPATAEPSASASASAAPAAPGKPAAAKPPHPAPTKPAARTRTID
jgi:serine/threonine-protein kinase